MRCACWACLFCLFDEDDTLEFWPICWAVSCRQKGVAIRVLILACSDAQTNNIILIALGAFDNTPHPIISSHNRMRLFCLAFTTDSSKFKLYNSYDWRCVPSKNNTGASESIMLRHHTANCITLEHLLEGRMGSFKKAIFAGGFH